MPFRVRSHPAGFPIKPPITAEELGAEIDFPTHLADYAKYVAQPVYNVKGFGAKGDGETDDTSAIQAAIEACPPNLITLKIHKLQGRGTIELVAGPDNCSVILGELDGVDKTADGIILSQPRATVQFRKIKNCNRGIVAQNHSVMVNGNQITACNKGTAILRSDNSLFLFGQISECQKGIEFDAQDPYTALENRIIFGSITSCDYGIYFSDSPQSMEGNIMIGAIFACSVCGLYFAPNGNSKRCLFIGVSDQAASTGTDIEDNVGLNTFLCYYVRPDKITIQPNSILSNTYDYAEFTSQKLYGRMFVISESADKLKGAELSPDGNIEIWSDAGTPYIDFKADKNADRDARILKTSSHGLLFEVGGASSLKTGLEIKDDGHVCLTRVMRDDYGGNFANFTPPTADAGKIVLAEDTNSGGPARRQYVCIDGTNWTYVDLS